MRQGPNHICWKLGRLEAGLSDARPIFRCTFLQGAGRLPALIPFPLLEKPDGLHSDGLCPQRRSVSSGTSLQPSAQPSLDACLFQPPTPPAKTLDKTPHAPYFPRPSFEHQHLERLHGKGRGVQTGPVSQDERVHALARPSQPLLPQESGFTVGLPAPPSALRKAPTKHRGIKEMSPQPEVPGGGGQVSL